ncbi:hypothetical protein NDU88_007206 [Pleurodeles waltl]|uniref:Uncharacterized protein n=1 Tax=Pleurodeles waltl TaxID=8319 RepID=A0AAV7VP13_PLEWA|nr:hypothetical protein NDU88_007206 [Pleurodeles waltl]
MSDIVSVEIVSTPGETHDVLKVYFPHRDLVDDCNRVTVTAGPTTRVGPINKYPGGTPTSASRLQRSVNPEEEGYTGEQGTETPRNRTEQRRGWDERQKGKKRNDRRKQRSRRKTSDRESKTKKQQKTLEERSEHRSSQRQKKTTRKQQRQRELSR